MKVDNQKSFKELFAVICTFDDINNVTLFSKILHGGH